MQSSEFYRVLNEVLPGGDYVNAKKSSKRLIYFTRLSMDGLDEMHAYSTDDRLYEYLEHETFKTIEVTRHYLQKLIDLEKCQV